jgi:hypothetical protein
MSEAISSGMIETLYKTSQPEKDLSEYYSLVIHAPHGKGSRGYTFEERHGRWDEAAKRPLLKVTTISPEEGLSFAEAQKMYTDQRQHRSDGDFRHSFSPDYFGEKPYEY